MLMKKKEKISVHINYDIYNKSKRSIEIEKELRNEKDKVKVKSLKKENTILKSMLSDD